MFSVLLVYKILIYLVRQNCSVVVERRGEKGEGRREKKILLKMGNIVVVER